MRSVATLKYLFALTLYGTIGLFLHFISYSSEFVVLCRGSIGTLFILLVLLTRKDKIDFQSIRNNLKTLMISGFALGFNWVFLFAGYRHGIAITSLCNYLAPLIVVVIMATVYKQKINSRQLGCIALAFVGMLLLTGIFESNNDSDIRCVIYGLLAAFGFVIMVLCNKKLSNIKDLEKTLMQLFFSVLIVLPYVIFNDGFPKQFDMQSTILVIILGVLHTGVAYICYFAAIHALDAQTIAVLGYLEPALNFFIGAFILKENITIYGVIGAIMILLASIGNEIFADKNE
ncbi:MAG: EamA family transporter [Erysipelotrichaceae bacterium]|nr:EamA family transporter [Erysipelotrichaceae bacterium]